MGRCGLKWGYKSRISRLIEIAAMNFKFRRCVKVKPLVWPQGPPARLRLPVNFPIAWPKCVSTLCPTHRNTHTHTYIHSFNEPYALYAIINKIFYKYLNCSLLWTNWKSLGSCRGYHQSNPKLKKLKERADKRLLRELMPEHSPWFRTAKTKGKKNYWVATWVTEKLIFDAKKIEEE